MEAQCPFGLKSSGSGVDRRPSGFIANILLHCPRTAGWGHKPNIGRTLRSLGRRGRAGSAAPRCVAARAPRNPSPHRLTTKETEEAREKRFGPACACLGGTAGAAVNRSAPRGLRSGPTASAEPVTAVSHPGVPAPPACSREWTFRALWSRWPSRSAPRGSASTRAFVSAARASIFAPSLVTDLTCVGPASLRALFRMTALAP